MTLLHKDSGTTGHPQLPLDSSEEKEKKNHTSKSTEMWDHK